MLLAITSRTNLEAQYGPGSLDKIREAFSSYALSAQPIEAHLYAPDDSVSAAFFKLPLLPATTGEQLAMAVRRVRSEHEISAVMLVGGPEIVPHCLTHNLNQNDGDLAIPTDNHFGCKSDDPSTFMIPDIPIGRLSGEMASGVKTLIAHMETMAGFHRSAANRSGAAAVGCLRWSDATRAVTNMFAGGVPECSPSFLLTSHSSSVLSAKYIYINLHGFKDDSAWNGQGTDGLVACVDPSGLQLVDLRGSVLFAANCYGANLTQKSVDTSCAITAIAGGVKSFVGSTCFSYGAGSHSANSVLYSDRFAQLFFAEHIGGSSAGESLRRARLRYVAETITSVGLPARENKTAFQFILLGDPTL
jgi:hypothetical protein